MKVKGLHLNKILIFIVSFLAIGIGIVSIHNRLTYREPFDGIELIEAKNGILYIEVEKESPAAIAGLKSGDKLYAIEAQQVLSDGIAVVRSWSLSNSKQITTTVYHNNKKQTTLSEEIIQATDCQKILWYQGVVATANYKVLRNNQLKEANLKISGKPLENNNLYLFLSVIGFFFLFIGFSVAFNPRGLGEHHIHFFLLCLLFFLLFCLSYTNDYVLLGRTIFWLETGARLFLPAIFLHFFLIFPNRRKTFISQPRLVSLLYIPAVILLLINIGLIHYNSIISIDSEQAGLKLNYYFQALYNGELVYLAIFFITGVSTLIWSYRLSRSIWIKKQIKWILWGMSLGLGPLAIVYVPFYLINRTTAIIEIFTTIPLIIIPVSIAYAILKYKLMDVEVIIKRGMVFALATGSVMAVYMLLVNSISTYIPGIGPEYLAAITFFATLLVVILFPPIKKKIQFYLDKILYKDRYDVRIALKGFSYELSKEVNLKTLLDTIVRRVADTLNVENVAIALYSENKQRVFKLVKKVGKEIVSTNRLSPEFSEFISSALAEKDFLTLAESSTLAEEFPNDKTFLNAFNQLHLIPFIVKEEMKALLIVGTKEDNLPLSSEDLQLLTTLAAPAAIAIENALLYQTVNRKAEELAELKDYLENIVESINAGVLVINLDERIISWNRKLELLYGLKRSEAIGQKLSEVFPQDFLKSASTFFGQNGWVAREINSIYKIPLRNKLDMKIVVNLSIAPLFKKDGEIHGKVIIFDDITDRVSLEEQLQHSEKLAALGYLSASVAHEVNTPLTGISSYIQMLQKKTDRKSPQAEILKKVEKHCFRASQIVNNLLNFSSKKEAQFQEIDVNEVIQETVSLIDYQLKRSKIDMKLHLDTQLPKTYGDQGKLQQLFINMFLNARDSMQQGGTLGISTSSENSHIIVNIKDTGIGIPDKNIDKIYNPFFTTKAAGGTGLGLSVSYGIIQEHMGTISVKSTPGKGTIFKIKLPIYRGKHAEEETHINY